MAYAVYSSVINQMNGKQAFKKIRKPSDVFPLPTDAAERPMSDKEAEAFLTSIAKK